MIYESDYSLACNYDIFLKVPLTKILNRPIFGAIQIHFDVIQEGFVHCWVSVLQFLNSKYLIV